MSATTSAPAPPAAWLGLGQVRHRRLRPARHSFAYPALFLLLPMRSLRASASSPLPRNRLGLLAFRDADHGDGRADCLAWLDDVLAREGVHDATGEVWLQCFPRMLGFAFKPVSFWHCHRADGSLRAVLVEVNNTFGERHCYLLDGADVAYGRELRARKAFHVSPFCRVEGDYRFRFARTDLGAAPSAAPRALARVDHHDDAGVLLETSLSGRLVPVTRASLRTAFWRHPLFALAVVARIHLHAARLWLKRVPFVAKPAPPRRPVSR